MRLDANVTNTIKNFSSVMTNGSKVISELVQNARRAGASCIDVRAEAVDGTVNLSVADNGCGIDDFKVLFTLSESGWDGATQDAEGSFGMGFFALFFSCEEVEIKSNGKRMAVDASLARTMQDFGEPLVEPSVPNNFTKITLSKVKLSFEQVESKIKELARYSRIAIAFNGELLVRDRSLEYLSEQGYPLVETPFGMLVITSDFSQRYNVVLQDLLVYASPGYGDPINYIFSDHLKARMPDRDVLIDQKTVTDDIDAWLNAYYRDKLLQIRSDMKDDVAFLDRHFENVALYCNDILSEIDYLPADAFWQVSYPTQRSDYEPEKFVHECGLHKHESFIGVHVQLDVSDSPVAANFVYYAKARIAKMALPDNHWFYGGCIEVANENEFVIHCKDVTHLEFTLAYTHGDAVIAKEVMIEHVPSKHKVVVHHDGFASLADIYWRPDDNGVNDAAILIDGVPGELPHLVLQSDGHIHTGRDLLLQLNSYISEYDEWLETDLELDCDSFHRQLLAALGGNIEDVLTELLGTLPPAIAQKLDGKAMQMTVHHGKATFKLVA